MSTTTKTPKPLNGRSQHRLSRRQIVHRINQGARARRGMSAEELVAAYRRGKLADPGEVSDLLMLAGLLAKKDKLFVAP